jgi:hypothetical protein
MRSACATNVINIDAVASRYKAFLLSLRLLRGNVVLMGSELLVIWLIVLPSLYIAPIDDQPSSALFNIGCSLLITAFVGLVFLVYLYTFRVVAAGSRRAGWIICSIFGVLLVLGTVAMFIVDPAMTPHGSVAGSGWKATLIRAAIASYSLPGQFVLFLIAFGLFRAVSTRDVILRQLVTDKNYDRRFWISWRVLARNFWHLMGFSAPPRRGKMPVRITVAAALALIAESSGFYIYADMNASQLEKRLDRLAMAELSQNEVIIALSPGLLLTPALVWMGFALSRGLRRYARRRAIVSADEARQVDSRAPILFLRSFRDEQVSLAKAKMPRLLRFLDPGSVSRTLEEMLVREYAYLGPVVTIGQLQSVEWSAQAGIGRPDKMILPLGAFRKYCWSDDWQQVVGSIMDVAALVVVGVDKTDGLIWEIAELRQRGLLGKTLFILNPSYSADREMLASLCAMTGLTAALPALKPTEKALSLCFGSSNRGLLAVSTRVTETEYQLALRMPAIREQLFSEDEAHQVPTHPIQELAPAKTWVPACQAS